MKRILYHGPSAERFERLTRALANVPGCTAAAGPSEATTLIYGGMPASFVCHMNAGEVFEDLHRSYVNLLVLDMRCAEGCLDEQVERMFGILSSLDSVEDVEDRYAFHRILVLVGGASPSRVDEVIRELGARGVGGVLRHAEFEDGDGADGAWARRFLDMAWGMMKRRRQGKLALCAAGGGVTAIFFEQGTLKCFDDCFGAAGVNMFDMYFGISAGAVVTGPLAVGYSIDEFMASTAGVEGGRIPPIDFRLFRLGHLNYSGFVRRVRRGLATAWADVRGAFFGRRELTRERLFFDYADLVAPPLRADRFEELMRGILSTCGATNDFRELRRSLYVGATDQDERRHVLFGDEQHNDIPISQAIQASLSINPAFCAVPIRGRYYEDGAITRTSNFMEAIRRGANLVLVIDPFLPHVVRAPGFHDSRSVFFNIDQDIRTISFTRYELTRNMVLRKHPEVSSYTFVPANRLRRLISQNPLDHRPYLEIWRGSYLSTLNRLIHLRHRLEGDLQLHGVTLDLTRAEAVAERLKAASRVKFSDFFPDGRVELKTPPMDYASCVAA